MVIVWFWRMLYVMACHVAMHTTLHGDTRVSDNVIPRHHHETKKEVACLPDQVVEELFFVLGIYPISISMNGNIAEFRICSEQQTEQTEYHATAKEGGVRAHARLHSKSSQQRNLSSKFRNHLILDHANSIISVYNNNKDSYCMQKCKGPFP